MPAMAMNLVTIEQLSVLVGQTPRNIFLLTERGVLKKAVDDAGKQLKPIQYELMMVVRSYCDYLRELAKLDDQGATVYQQLRNKKIGAEAEKAVLDLKTYKNKLHRSQDVEYVMNTMMSTVRSRLLSIPSRITRVLMGKTVFQEIHDIIDAEIQLALRELSDYDPNAFSRANEDYLAQEQLERPPHSNGNTNHQETFETSESEESGPEIPEPVL
jgi:phage terminase Nu1 subunit (DNA packaging protein)